MSGREVEELMDKIHVDTRLGERERDVERVERGERGAARLAMRAERGGDRVAVEKRGNGGRIVALVVVPPQLILPW